MISRSVPLSVNPGRVLWRDPDSPIAERDRERAAFYREEAAKLREQRSALIEAERDRADGKETRPRDPERGRSAEPTEAEKVRGQDEEAKKREGLNANEAPEARPGNKETRQTQNREAAEWAAAGRTVTSRDATAKTPTQGRGGGKGR